MTGVVGLAALPEGARVDFTRMRAARRTRLWDAMAAHGLDALVLGRPANVAYATGARQLWTAGARPFGPACVLVAATGRIHLLSTWDEGVPEEISREDLFGLTWNPAVATERLAAIAGMGTSVQVGTDGYSPGAAHALARAWPDARIVDGGPALDQARRVKTADELACIVTAAAMAEAAMTGLAAALRPGVTERQLLAGHIARLAALGAPTLPTEAVVWATARQGPVAYRGLVTDRALGPGELVVCHPGAHYAGYEASLARTWLVGGGAANDGPGRLFQRAAALRRRLVEACRVGATGANLLAAWASTGEPFLPGPVVGGVGLGAEAPVVAAGVGEASVLTAGMVLAVRAWVTSEGVGGVLEEDLVQVTDAGPQLLTRYGREQRAEGE